MEPGSTYAKCDRRHGYNIHLWCTSLQHAYYVEHTTWYEELFFVRLVVKPHKPDKVSDAFDICI